MTFLSFHKSQILTNTKNMITKLRLLRVAVLSAVMGFSGVTIAQTYTFTNATATGNVGPTQGMVDAEYTGTNLDGNVTVTGGIQTWVVPVTGIYEIQTFGGQGYGAFGGRGAHITGEFNLTAGTVLKILVGQMAGDYLNYPATTYNHQFGGGGGSFVTLSDNTPLIIAGGGGGNHGNSFLPQCDGQITEAGSAGLNGSITGAGGTAGQGGFEASSADAGGGLLTNGGGTAGGQAFVNGALGGIDEGTGGFGCGGGTSSWNNYRGGGGGGYSGGGGGNNSSTCCPAGGGGGSYNSGTNPTAIAGVQTGHGMVIITNQCIPTGGSLTTDAPSLSDYTSTCVVNSITPPTATNDCASGFDGVPDVTFPITTPGTTVVTWTFDDGVNLLTQTQNVIITSSLVADVPTLSDVSDGCIVNSLPTPTASNDCVSGINGVSDAVFPITSTTVVTWTYDDGISTITQTQNVNISGIDTDPPVLDNASLPTLGGQCNFTPPIPTATDVCSGVISGVADVTFPMYIEGTTTITWTFDDGNGNSVTQTQTINLDDVAPPALDVPNLPDFIGCNSANPTPPTATDYCAGVLTGTPDVTFPITTLGLTTVTWSYDDGNGNTIDQTQDIYVNTVDASTSVSGTTISAVSATATYQWYDCGTSQPIAGETNQSYTPTVTGDYAVEVTENGCTEMSACTNVDFTGISELNSNLIQIYPNPTNNGIFTVTFDGEMDQISVVDAIGRTIELPVDLSSGKVDGASLAAGKYIVKVITSDRLYTKAIVVLD